MEWITAREAISILAGHCSGIDAEAEALRQGAATGAFAARADRMIRRVKAGFNAEGYAETDTDWLVPFDLWEDLEIGFARGLEHGHLRAHPDWRTTVILTGVRFEKAPLLEYAAAMGEPAKSNKTREEAAQRTAEWLRKAEATLQASRAVMENAKATAPTPQRAAVERARKLGADLGPRSDPYIGLTEAAAWVATRDQEVAAALHAITYYKDGQAGNLWQSTTWMNFPALHGAFSAIAARCSTGADLTAIGRKGGAGGFEPIPSLEWIGARIWFQDDPDIIAPASSVSPGQSIIGPVWTHVKLPRQSVLEIWPQDGGEAPVQSLRAGSPLRLVASSPALKPPSISEVREWIRRGVEDGKSQREMDAARTSAFPNNAAPPRQLVRDIYGEEYEAKHGQKPAAGAPAKYS